MIEKYSYFLEFSDKDQCYIATVKELLGCCAHGETPDEALENLLDAQEIWIETAKEEGLEIPLPESKEDKAHAYEREFQEQQELLKDTFAKALKILEKQGKIIIPEKAKSKPSTAQKEREFSYAA